MRASRSMGSRTPWGCCAFSITLSAFGVYMVILPMVWLDESEAQRADLDVAGQVPGRPTEPAPTPFGNASGGGERADPYIATQNTAGRSYASWIQDSGVAPAHLLQYHILVSFINEYQVTFATTLFFVFHLLFNLIDLADRFHDSRMRAC
mmetsp:Transcript_15955/g.43768  ORF Transcript_15955/g.43768 Transcript_15955/m.43768 type:complete len:150 (-) Transcript_15955:54-503(-)